jgi:hypothetical protein
MQKHTGAIFQDANFLQFLFVSLEELHVEKVLCYLFSGKKNPISFQLSHVGFKTKWQMLLDFFLIAQRVVYVAGTIH